MAIQALESTALSQNSEAGLYLCPHIVRARIDQLARKSILKTSHFSKDQSNF
jgi:hypothetical protein